MRNTLIILLLFFSMAINGQSFKLFTANSELSSSLINMVYQDRNGMIWIATEDGLNRFDGAKFTIYKHEKDNQHSLCHNYVRTLFEDSKGHLIVGTYSGLQVYDPATDHFSPKAKWDNGQDFDSNIISILERRNGRIWVSGNNLCEITFSKSGLVMKKLNLPIPTTMTDFMIEDKHQNIWMTKGENGIYRLDPDNQTFDYLEQDKGITIIDICEDINGDIYAGTMSKGLLKYDRKSDAFTPIAYKGKRNLPVKVLYSGSQDELYIGTDGKGLKVFNKNKQQITDYPFENSYFDSHTSKVHSILKDNAGNFWLAIYQKGVLMIPAQPNSFKYMGYKSIDKNIIGSNCITSLFRDHDGILWVGTDNDGIYGITEDGRQKVHYSASDDEHSVPSTVFNLYEDSEYNLWFGSYIKGIGKLDRQTGKCSYRKDLLDKNGNFVQRVYDIKEDKNKRLWIATMGSGLYCHDLKTGHTSYNEKANKDINNWIGCLFYSSDNKLYAGTYDGVSCVDLNTDDFNTRKLLPHHIILSIYEDKYGIIWLGCSEGLTSWDKKTETLVTYTTADGLPSDVINAIQGDDEQDYLWISTNAGISQFHLKTHQFINYYVGDGLQGNEFSKNASFKDKGRNILWFGGMNGITYFNPREITNPAKKWNIRITDFYLNNKPVRKGVLSGGHEIIDCPVFEADKFRLSHNDNSFSIEFSILEMSNPERVTYHYAMNDDKWINLPQGINRVSFSNLAPGTYRFRVKAQDYMIDSEIKDITVQISPAWWASGWAKLIYCLLALGIIYFIIMQVRHRYLTKQKMLQHIHAEQINEAKLQFFINISHEIRTPMSLIISPLQKLMTNDTDINRQKIYHTIYRNAERILRLVNQLMDIRKIDKGQMSLIFRETDIILFINDICETFSEQATKNNITLLFHHEGMEELKLWIDPVNFDKIIMNVLSNAFKFTPENGRVDIYLKEGKDPNNRPPLCQYIDIIIADNGIGIDEKEIIHIFERFYQIRNHLNNSEVGTGIGLHLTQSLVELHHGEIHAENNPDGMPGCRFIIRLPKGKDHLSNEELDYSEGAYVSPQKTPFSLSANLSEEKETKTRTKTKFRILVVEDDDEIRQYICNELSSEYHMLESSNGKEALAAIFKRVPDLVISDVMMPEMDGLTLCYKIKQNVNLNHLPVILLTAKTREEDNIEGLDTGADAYITKPFNIEILRKTAANLIRSRERLRNTLSGKQLQEDKLQKIEALSPDDKLMERIMKVINNNLSNPNLTVEMITQEVGISRVHLHRKLKELTNQTTRDFIRNARLKQAAILLSEKRYSITEVAELTGFTNPNNFSTAFRELYGVPPTTYMEMHLGKNS